MLYILHCTYQRKRASKPHCDGATLDYKTRQAEKLPMVAGLDSHRGLLGNFSASLVCNSEKDHHNRSHEPFPLLQEKYLLPVNFSICTQIQMDTKVSNLLMD